MSLEERFVTIEFPIALKMGLTYNQFWHEEAEIFQRTLAAYRINLEETREIERQTLDLTCWLTGYYVREAIVSTVGNMFKKGGKGHDYPSQPHLLKPTTNPAHEGTQSEDDKLIMQNYADMLAWSQAFNRQLDRQGE